MFAFCRRERRQIQRTGKMPKKGVAINMTSYGKNLTVRLFGGSHDSEIGVTAEGLPAGIRLDRAALSAFLRRRAPGLTPESTARREDDEPIFESGLDENDVTDGSTLRAVIRNRDARPDDYSMNPFLPRPSHADYPAYVKSGGTADLRGGGHYSGRLTAPLCVLGGLLLGELEMRGIRIGAHIRSIGSVSDRRFDPVAVTADDFDAIISHDFPVLDPSAADPMKAVIRDAKANGDSVGGVIECATIGLPVGLGESFFDGLESRIASIVFSIPGVKGVEFGDGFASALLRGSEHNDPYVTDGKTVSTRTNHAGGLCGGLSTGMPLLFSAAVKPTSSIAKEQDTVNLTEMTPARLTVRGRHDPCIVPRAVPVVEAAAAIALFDALLDGEDQEA